MKLIDVLLQSPAGPQIREMLQLQSEAVFTELMYLKLRRVSEKESHCEIQACIARIDGDSLAQDAVDLVFRCFDVTSLDWYSSFCEKDDCTKHEITPDEIEIDTDDSFWVRCKRIEVMTVKPYKLGIEK